MNLAPPKIRPGPRPRPA